MDLHLYICNTCEVFFGSKICPGANLDVDDTNGYGPETVTIENYFETIYLLFVYQYAGDSTIALSEGKLDIIPVGYDPISVEIPSDMGNENSDRYWFIGKFNGIQGLNEIEISNTIMPYIDFSAYNCQMATTTLRPTVNNT